jgi:flagellar protein FliS
MNALLQYQAVSHQTSIVDADRHKLIQLLFDGLIDRLSMAKGQIQQKNYEGKNNLINKAVEIVGGLSSFLDMEKGGEISTNLSALYEYIERKLFEANLNNSIEILDEVIHLVKTVKEGWDGIREEVLQKGLV